MLKVIQSSSAKNTAVAAGASERVINAPTYASKGGYERWNSLEVYNRDNVAIEIRLDEQTSGTKVFQIPANTIFVLEHDEGIEFDTVDQANLDGATAETANKIFFKASVKKEV
ncbi:hypothetical protein HYX00_01460 [Candidatus Woesearchaeota archaeon]|nr:hypothetical protein [Candidatus Woesearchaeota archaeon]